MVQILVQLPQYPPVWIPPRKSRCRLHSRRRNSERCLPKTRLVGTPRFECFDVCPIREMVCPSLGADSANELDIFVGGCVLAPVLDQVKKISPQRGKAASGA